jgi:hypothetical protein
VDAGIVINNNRKFHEKSSDKCSGELFARYVQMQYDLVSICGWDNVFSCSLNRGNDYYRHSVLEGAVTKWREETSVIKTEDSVILEKDTAYSTSETGGFAGSGSSTLRGKSGRPANRKLFEYYCSQKGCNQKERYFSIQTPPPTCKRLACERYGMEMVLRQ